MQFGALTERQHACLSGEMGGWSYGRALVHGGARYGVLRGCRSKVLSGGGPRHTLVSAGTTRRRRVWGLEMAGLPPLGWECERQWQLSPTK